MGPRRPFSLLQLLFFYSQEYLPIPPTLSLPTCLSSTPPHPHFPLCWMAHYHQQMLCWLNTLSLAFTVTKHHLHTTGLRRTPDRLLPVRKPQRYFYTLYRVRRLIAALSSEDVRVLSLWEANVDADRFYVVLFSAPDQTCCAHEQRVSCEPPQIISSVCFGLDLLVLF